MLTLKKILILISLSMFSLLTLPEKATATQQVLALPIGSVVLFSCNDLIGLTIKNLTHSQWSHSGVIVPNPTSTAPGASSYCLEATGSTKEVLTGTSPHVRLTPMNDLMRNYNGAISIRECKYPLSAEVVQRFVNTYNGRPYEQNLGELMGSVDKRNTAENSDSVFCSELVALGFQEWGILPPYPYANNYVPGDLSTEQKFIPNYFFTSETKVKGAHDTGVWTRIEQKESYNGTISDPIILADDDLRWANTITLTLKDIRFSGKTIDPKSGPLNLSAEATLTATTDTKVSKDMILNGDTSLETKPATTFEFAGVLKGQGKVMIKGQGTVIMSNQNTYTGPTSISSGRLHLASTLTSPITVSQEAVFSGNGTVIGTVTNNGTVEPAIYGQDKTFTTGTLTIKGDYTQTGSLTVLLGKSNDTWISSCLDVTGSVAFNKGSTIIFKPVTDGILDPKDLKLIGQTYVFLKAEKGIMGLSYPMETATPKFPGIDVQIVDSKPQTGGHEMYAILHPTNPPTVTNTATLSPEINVSTVNILSTHISRSHEGTNMSGKNDYFPREQRSFRDIAYRPQPSRHLFQDSGQRYSLPKGWKTLFSVLDQSGPLYFDQGMGQISDKIFWLEPVYGQGRNKQTSSSGASTDNLQLILTGLEWKSPEANHVIGISLGGGFGEAKSSVISGNHSHHKTIQGAVYYSKNWDGIRWDVFANGNRMISNNNRVANVSTGYTVKSTSITETLGASTEISYKVDLGDFFIIRPYYGLDYWYVIAHGYREKNDSIYAQSHARITSAGYDHFLGASIRKTWMYSEKYFFRIEGDFYYCRNLHDPILMDVVSAVDGRGMIYSRAIGGYGRNVFGPSLTFSILNQETGTKYFISCASTIQNQRVSYQGLLKVSIPLNQQSKN